MADLNPFYKYYDLIFSSKDYLSEIDSVFTIASQYSRRPFERILEIGCGTGNHTIILAQRKVSVVALDTDKQMISLAQQKALDKGLNNVQFFCDRIENLQCNDIDLALALFHVVTYISDADCLVSFFHAVKSILVPGGIFIFDCWNGVAALHDPPRSKTTEFVCQDKKIICALTNETDLFLQITTLNYQITVFDSSGKEIESGKYLINQALWTPMQIKSALKKVGLEVLKICKPFQSGCDAENSDWKIMFVCQCVK